ncbi:hypothetical protein RUM43_013935 [Polyplax serrata]|uniref:Uncharacterized protein n=1 Tax=Polyplax serrata TaxID=468196 RepID=A0AAN8P1P8_POLSC
MNYSTASVLLFICGLISLALTMPTDDEFNPDYVPLRVRRSFKQLPTGLLDTLLSAVRGLIPESLLGKVTMLLPLPAASEAPEMKSS